MIARVSTWPMCGLPLAVGGPSKNVNCSFPSRWWKLLRMISFSFHSSAVFFSLAAKFISVATLLYMVPSPPMSLSS